MRIDRYFVYTVVFDTRNSDNIERFFIYAYTARVIIAIRTRILISDSYMYAHLFPKS